MKRHLLTLVASAASLALANVAVAEEAQVAIADEPILLTDAQMDGVTAGGAFASGSFFAQCTSATCSAFGTGSTSFNVFDNDVNNFASAFSSLTVTHISGTVQSGTSAFAQAFVP